MSGVRRAAVVVPCRDEEGTIGACLRSVRRQQPAPALVVVVDNGSADGTVAAARPLADVVLSAPGASVAALRNAGAAAASGCEVLAFLDADCEAGAGWLAAALDALEGADVVGARTDAPGRAAWVARRWSEVERTLGQAGSYVGSRNMAVRADAFRRVGGFDEALRTTEDVDLCLRVRAAGGSVAVAPGMHVLHHGYPATLVAFARRERWLGSTPGWWWRSSRRGRAAVGLTGLWVAVGLAAAVRAARGRGSIGAAAWAAASLPAVPLAGLAAAGRGHAVQDGILLVLWALARATRLPRGLRRAPAVTDPASATSITAPAHRQTTSGSALRAGTEH